MRHFIEDVALYRVFSGKSNECTDKSSHRCGGGDGLYYSRFEWVLISLVNVGGGGKEGDI